MVIIHSCLDQIKASIYQDETLIDYYEEVFVFPSHPSQYPTYLRTFCYKDFALKMFCISVKTNDPRVKFSRSRRLDQFPFSPLSLSFSLFLTFSLCPTICELICLSVFIFTPYISFLVPYLFFFLFLTFLSLFLSVSLFLS